MEQNKEELLKHLAASLEDAKSEGGAILLVGAGISVSAGIPPAQKLMKIAIENFPNYFTEEEQEFAQKDLSKLQYNDIMTKLSNVKRKELFKWFIEGNNEKNIEKAKLNFAHIAIAELLKQGYFSRILTVNFDPLLIHACYMVGMYPFPAIYDLGAMGKVNAELLHDPSIVYLNGQHVGFVQRNTTDQLKAHKETLTQIVRSTGCNKTWVVAGYSGENDPLMHALNELRPYNNWLYWLEYSEQVIQKGSHNFLEKDEEIKVIYRCDADETFMEIAENLKCSLDFIERPHKELELYLNEIKFNSLRKKGANYQIKISEYIKILKSDQKQESFLTIDIANILINSFADSVEQDEKIIEICELILKQFPDHEEALSWLAFSYRQLTYKFPTNQEYLELALKLYEQIIKNHPERLEDYKFYIETLFDKLRITENNEERKNILSEIKILIDEVRSQPNFTDRYDEITELDLKRIKLLNDLTPYQPKDC
ncbi:hypothetical protein [Acinetobacter baumannii]|uniref:hypothetical protein n=1 Tax=Acinetobacter baumannii TaxID=470 RepID=UPI001CA99B30|nr:hypothetical protein [Acinetobacter baumannii]UAB16554.1 hypothetical protein H2786_01915 [Acinetobacter baumannii]